MENTLPKIKVLMSVETGSVLTYLKASHLVLTQCSLKKLLGLLRDTTHQGQQWPEPVTSLLSPSKVAFKLRFINQPLVVWLVRITLQSLLILSSICTSRGECLLTTVVFPERVLPLKKSSLCQFIYLCISLLFAFISQDSS